MAATKHKTDKAGKIARLVRLAKPDAERIRTACNSAGITLLSFYSTAAKAYLKARAQNTTIPITPTPTGVQFDVLTVRVDPSLFDELEAAANRDGVHLGRLLATTLIYGIDLVESCQTLPDDS